MWRYPYPPARFGPLDAGHGCVEANVVVEPPLLGNSLAVVPNLAPTRVGVTPIRIQLEGKGIHVRGHVAGHARVRVLAPGSADRVSLLENDPPAVYLTEGFVNMRMLDDIETRPLTAFEKDAVDRLAEGALVAQGREDDKLAFVGAIRAEKKCLSCHDAEVGDFLGAFVYRCQPQSKTSVRLPRYLEHLLLKSS